MTRVQNLPRNYLSGRNFRRKKISQILRILEKTKLKIKFLQNLINLLIRKIKFLRKFLPLRYNSDKGSSPNFISNIKRI